MTRASVKIEVLYAGVGDEGKEWGKLALVGESFAEGNGELAMGKEGIMRMMHRKDVRTVEESSAQAKAKRQVS